MNEDKDIVDAEDTTVHTIDQYSISDAIYSNGVLTYNGKPAYTIGPG